MGLPSRTARPSRIRRAATERRARRERRHRTLGTSEQTRAAPPPPRETPRSRGEIAPRSRTPIASDDALALRHSSRQSTLPDAPHAPLEAMKALRIAAHRFREFSARWRRSVCSSACRTPPRMRHTRRRTMTQPACIGAAPERRCFSWAPKCYELPDRNAETLPVGGRSGYRSRRCCRKRVRLHPRHPQRPWSPGDPRGPTSRSATLRNTHQYRIRLCCFRTPAPVASSDLGRKLGGPYA
jgi:hypothetical protein